jgi:hypothetical protein
MNKINTGVAMAYSATTFQPIGSPIAVHGSRYVAVDGYRAFITGTDPSGAHGRTTIIDLAPARPVVIGTINMSSNKPAGIAVAGSGLWVSASPTGGKALRLQYRAAGSKA